MKKLNLKGRTRVVKGWCFVFASCLFFGNVNAEGTCPPGYYPTDDGSKGVINCAPIPSGSGGAPRGPKWKFTWGAVAIDSTTGDMGTVVGEGSKSGAQREAMRRCERYDSRRCVIQLAYKNQCVVVAWPNAIGGHIFTQGGPSIEDATSHALPACKKASRVECRIVYAECTEPVLVY